MSLLNASLAAGILLVALPIVLHLIMRQRPKYLRFPALRFIQKRKEANRRKLQLRHLLLLALRCAAIALLALALARPSITGTGVLGKEGAPIAAALVFDTSPRMAYRQENLTRLEKAQQLADWLLSRLPPETAVSVIGSGSLQPIFAIDHGAAAQQVEHLATTAASRPLHEAIVEAIHLVRSKPEFRHEIYIFTDASTAAWNSEALRSIAAALGEDDEINLYVIDVGATDPQNVGITQIRLSDDVVARTADVSVTVELARTGDADAAEVELFLTDETGGREKRGQRSVDWQTGPVVAAEFPPISGLPEGTHQGVVRVDGQDALAADDVQYFTVEVRPPPAVLLLAEDDRQATFLREAIAPRLLVDAGRARFHADVVRFSQANGQMLANYAAVCLLDPPPLTTELWNALADYAADGGGVAIFLGHHALGHRDPFNAQAPQALLAGPLARVYHARPRTHISPDTYDHPAFVRFRSYAGDVPWRYMPVFDFWELGELHPAAATVAAYANGLPAIVERPVGSRGGRSITVTTPVSHAPSQRNPDPWNLLPVGVNGTNWPFVILMPDLVGYLAGTGENRLNYVAGETVTLELSQTERMEVERRKNYVVRTPSGESLLQTMRSGEGTIVFNSTDEPGNYQILAGGRTGALKRGFSVNLPPSTSRLDRADREEIAAALGEDRVRFARETKEIEVSIGLGRMGRELFPWMIGVLIVILAGEHVVANRFYRE